jgi:hypothetical protein
MSLEISWLFWVVLMWVFDVPALLEQFLPMLGGG